MYFCIKSSKACEKNEGLRLVKKNNKQTKNKKNKTKKKKKKQAWMHIKLTLYTVTLHLAYHGMLYSNIQR